LVKILSKRYLPSLQVPAGVYILENTSPPWGRGKISADVIWGKNIIRVREKGGKCKRKRKKEERKRKGKENEKRGRKGVK
jgi:hypothetical protein